MVIENKNRAPNLPLPLTQQNRDLMERRIGTDSPRHGTYYLRLSPGAEEIGFLAYHLVARPKTLAVKDVMRNWEMSPHDATAAWIFCNTFPFTAWGLSMRYDADEDIQERISTLKSESQLDPKTLDLQS